nr:MAG TPA: repressor domain protein [Caudoviricetes sp.]
MNELKIFENIEFGEIRTIKDDYGEPWFVGKDVAEILQYSNTTKAILNHVDDEDKKILTSQNGTLENIPNRGLTIINESGLYALIFSSKMKKAKEFKHWVTSEVLPSIRKHGAYATEDVLDKVLDNPDFGIELLNALKDERKKRAVAELENKKKDQIIGELTPKADYTDKILQSTSVVTITSIAKDYGLSGSKMNKLLHELGIQYKQGNQWLIYAKYHDKGYTHSETVEFPRSDGSLDVNMITKWTQKGRLFLYNELKDNGYLPMIERI